MDEAKHHSSIGTLIDHPSILRLIPNCHVLGVKITDYSDCKKKIIWKTISGVLLCSGCNNCIKRVPKNAYEDIPQKEILIL